MYLTHLKSIDIVSFFIYVLKAQCSVFQCKL